MELTDKETKLANQGEGTNGGSSIPKGSALPQSLEEEDDLWEVEFD